jgi:hypothetical protein
MSRSSAAASQGLAVLAHPQPGLDLATGAPGGRYQPGAVPREQVTVDPRLEVVALERGQRRHAEQVVHAGVVLCQQRHVRVGAGSGHVVAPAIAPLDAGAVEPAGARRDVGLEPDDGLDAVPLPGLPELVGAEQVAVVGGRERRHLLAGRLGEQVVDAGCPVEHRVLGVDVQVHERV